MGWLIVFFIIVAVILGVVQANARKRGDEKNREKLNDRLDKLESFISSKKIECSYGLYLFSVDEKNEKIAVLLNTYDFKISQTIINEHILCFSDIIGVELIEDGFTVSSKSTARTIGGAIVGGVLAGGAGTVVGGLSGDSKQKNKIESISVKILVGCISNCRIEKWHPTHN